jgi:hypothetical protein
MISTESCQMMGCGREGVRKSNRRGWTDQTRECSQLACFEKPLWTLTMELIMKDRTVKQVQFWRCLWDAGGERRRWRNMVRINGLCVHNRTMEHLVIAWSGTRRRWEGAEMEGDDVM